MILNSQRRRQLEQKCDKGGSIIARFRKLPAKEQMDVLIQMIGDMPVVANTQFHGKLDFTELGEKPGIVVQNFATGQHTDIVTIRPRQAEGKA